MCVSPMLKLRMRAWLRSAHRWVGLLLAVPLLCMAVTGWVLLLGRPLDEALNPQLFRVPLVPPQAGTAAASTRPHVDLDAALHTLRSRYGAHAAFTFRPPRSPGDALMVRVKSIPWRGQVWLHPADGTWLGQRGSHDGWFNTVFEFHSNLLLQDAGKPWLLGWAAAGLLLCVAGLWLWWPIRRAAGGWWYVRSKTAALMWWDMHRVAGVVLVVWVMLSLTTGAWMVWRPLAGWLTQTTGHAALAPVKLASSAGHTESLDELANWPVSGADGDCTPTTPDAALLTALAQRPQALYVGYLLWPETVKEPIRVRVRLPDDPHPNGLTTVWLSRDCTRVLRVDDWHLLDPGARSFAWVYPLHSGYWLGVLGWLMTLLGGGGLALLTVTGAWGWLRRRCR